MKVALSLTQPQLLRQQLAAAFTQLPTVQLAWQLGQRADTPGTAFFIGYQAAMRCLDKQLPPDCWAAFCISERGVRDPRQMHTTFNTDSGLLQGQKSHVMLAGQGLDRLCVVARPAEAGENLLALWLDATQVSVLPANPQPFLPDLPHVPVSFATRLPATALFSHDAHRHCNKPFRYWEDVHLALALAGWLQQQVVVNELQVAEVQERFERQPGYYDLVALDAVEALLAHLAQAAVGLPAEAAAQWQRDTVLLQFTAPVRSKIRQRLLQPE
ncbi:hypothetical protein GJQ55_02565 [Venatoribacter cucullus]|uniref:Acyl-CoA dehydrogenase n=1 Tax=Venatoribacter cucullus TaxID=2661630 RepID=A0A9X7UTL1_9GAMM|nr:hypothetical protein [Venatoribacter cucullus]QQD23432.1 hypothetical protein GJQ55_02565 [Venatoribacter cucullus]